jgi:membrane complex biogenesis BtpA family protein
MLHAPALPGSADDRGDFSQVRQFVLQDAAALIQGGVDGLMLENFGDTPFFPGRVPAITVAAMTAIATDLRQRFPVPLGINVLRNDGQGALAVAVASGASFIRVNVLCGSRVSDQGLLNAIAHDLLRDRSFLDANSIQIWADVDVKHSAPLAPRPLADEVHDLIDRGKADAVIVSGAATGQPVEVEKVRQVKEACRSTPVLVGSGVTAENAAELSTWADGIIVGSSLKVDGVVSNPVDRARVERLVQAVRDRS